jgi:CheY-like chemotaxis protein
VLRAARTILTCSAHARRIMDDVLTFSKMGARLLKIHPVPCQPVSLLGNALAIFQGDAMASAATLNFHVDESIHQLQVDWIFLDQGRCVQIVANLVTNALKFVRNRPVRTVDVTVAASLDRKPMTAQPGFTFLDPGTIQRVATELNSLDGQDVYLHVIVDDTGCGIPASEQAKLFSRFFQASHKTHTQYGGSGLGLSISKELCELQAGQIGFVSEAGKGSTFAFYIRTIRTTAPGAESVYAPTHHLPSKRYETDHLFREKGASRSLLSRQTIVTDSIIQPLDILLVEDNLTNQRVLQRQLPRHKHSVIVANNGIEALDAIKTTGYWRDCVDAPKNLSIILLDVEMPVMDGLTCIHHIRKLEAEGAITKRIPVIAVTANARQEQIDRALEAGMDDVLCKPFQFKELLQVVQRFI